MPNYFYNNTIVEFDFKAVNLEIEEFCEQNGVLANKVFSIQLILEELVTNIIKHGSIDKKKETIEITLAIKQDSIRLEIRDNTSAYNPLNASEPDTTQTAEERNIGGLGLFLVRKKVKSLEYENKDGFNIVIAQI